MYIFQSVLLFPLGGSTLGSSSFHSRQHCGFLIFVRWQLALANGSFRTFPPMAKLHTCPPNYCPTDVLCKIMYL